MDKYIIDISILNKRGHDYLYELFEFPMCYGNNLEALYNCLEELYDAEVTIVNYSQITIESMEMLAVFDQVANEKENIKVIYA